MKLQAEGRAGPIYRGDGCASLLYPTGEGEGRAVPMVCGDLKAHLFFNVTSDGEGTVLSKKKVEGEGKVDLTLDPLLDIHLLKPKATSRDVLTILPHLPEIRGNWEGNTKVEEVTIELLQGRSMKPNEQWAVWDILGISFKGTRVALLFNPDLYKQSLYILSRNLYLDLILLLQRKGGLIPKNVRPPSHKVEMLPQLRIVNRKR